MSDGSPNKTALAKALGLARSTLYYHSKQAVKDWRLKARIEDVLAANPSYGYPRVAQALHVNHKRAERVMHLFGLKAYRRRGRRWRKPRKNPTSYPNLLRAIMPAFPGHVWAADFTHLWYRGKVFYLATTLDLFTREIVGWSLQTSHGVGLPLQALFGGLAAHAHPNIFHSDNGSEYGSVAFAHVLEDLGVAISRSRPGCPWENGYQESFYSSFKVDLGDPNRFASLGEFVYALYRAIHTYNRSRIHTALKMPPLTFAKLALAAPVQASEKASDVWGY
ncbi:IS3 family transposase [Candidatus Peregrinibacteria bacterium]|nr:IS3 family transposase [Candidatus Peregrinibacteria bacterium]